MRTKIAVWLATTSIAFAIAACGGHVADVGGDGGSSGSDGGSCGEPPSGCTATSSTTCNDGCNECTCANGGWACTLLFCPVDSGPPMCPANPPTALGYCASEGQSCDYHASECGGESCKCSGHQWLCAISDCPPPPPCPSSPPNFGQSCPVLNQSCSWGSGCSSVACQCMSANNGLAWTCEGTACADAGIVEAGHTDAH